MPTRLIYGIIQSTFDLGRVLRKKMHSSDPSDLHMGQIHALAFIKEFPGITMSKVADMLQVSSPTATSFVERLVRMGYVTRHHDEKNRKFVCLEVTSQGMRILESKMTEKRKIIAEVLSVLPEQDQKTLHSLLSKIISVHSRS